VAGDQLKIGVLRHDFSITLLMALTG
jgi:hypothetical protein